jgi:hypothetical protein
MEGVADVCAGIGDGEGRGAGDDEPPPVLSDGGIVMVVDSLPLVPLRSDGFRRRLNRLGAGDGFVIPREGMLMRGSVTLPPCAEGLRIRAGAVDPWPGRTT